MNQAKDRPVTLESAPDYLKAPEIAMLLGISRAHAYNLVNSDGFPRLMITVNASDKMNKNAG